MTLTDLLAQYNFTPAQIYELRKNIKPVYDLGKIKAGHELRIYSTQQGEISSLEYDINEENFLHIQKKESTYTAEIKKIPYTPQKRSDLIEKLDLFESRYPGTKNALLKSSAVIEFIKEQEQNQDQK